MNKVKRIAEYGKMIHEKGMVIGAGGNISERDGRFLIIKKKGADMSSGKTDNYARVPLKEAGAEKELLSTETPMHVASYNARADIEALIHIHSPAMIAAAERTDLVESTSYEFDCILKKAVPVIDYIEPGSRPLAQAASEKLAGGADAVMMRRHGAIIAGGSIEEAYLRMLALERACRTFLYLQ